MGVSERIESKGVTEGTESKAEFCAEFAPA